MVSPTTQSNSSLNCLSYFRLFRKVVKSAPITNVGDNGMYAQDSIGSNVNIYFPSLVSMEKLP